MEHSTSTLCGLMPLVWVGAAVAIALLTAAVLISYIALRTLLRSQVQLLCSLEEANRLLACGAMATDAAVRNRIAAMLARPGSALPPAEAAAYQPPVPAKPSILTSVARSG